MSEIISSNNRMIHEHEMTNRTDVDRVSLYILNLEEYRRYSEVHQYYMNLKLQLDIEYEKIRFVDNAAVFKDVVTTLKKGECDIEKLTELEGKVNEIR